ncbi:AraC family transcriptional regulator [Verrucomicrobium sp. BvORR106]|uniref:AraC family transcriptional regulator n=1 Tax=Verrucomicrobium sp. BvORR106 TaxID=1403819 RepID=UPI00056ED7B6|nr:AraC family transcriptional regulator [Verrucomicrobium sp. BvORR106]
MNQHFRISNLLAARLAEQGLLLPALLRLAGLPAGFFDQERILATTAELFALYRAIGEMSPDPGIGLKLGVEERIERYHPTAVVAVCSRSYRDALQRMARYKQLTCPEQIRLTKAGEETTVEFVFTAAEEIEPELLVDVALSWILSVGRRGTGGQIVPLRLELARHAQNRELLEQHFGCRVRYKAGRNALVFRDRDLDRPFVTHNEELLAALGPQLDNELEAQTKGLDLGEQVRHCLKRSLAGRRPTIQDVAQELGMSSRTLQRRLGEASLTFQKLVEDTRRQLAHHYLRQSTVELSGVAFLLGYEDSNSFFRAFHGWEGTTPGEWRGMVAR